MKELYVIKTDKSYLKGDMWNGVDFVEKENARRFDETDILLYWDSISADLTQFFDIKKMEKELA